MDMIASMEAEMDAIIESLCGPSDPGLSDNLVDSEGFPRTDIDVSAVRSQRRRLAEFRNDHKDITGQIEKNLQVLHSLKLNKVTPPPPESSGLFRFDAMALDGSEVHTRFQHLLVQLQIEAGVLDRIVYRNKNQHRHGSYFQYLLKVRRDLKLLQSAELGLILKMLFPIIDGKKPVRTALVPTRLKSKSIGLNHNLKNHLLGCARLLSQMTEPILKAAIQISLLLAKSFFLGFCITIMALLARLRILVQQMLQDVVIVFNKVSFLTTEKQSIKLSQDGIEVYREFHRPVHKRLVLECVWKGDKYLLLERTESTEDEIRCDIQATPSSTTTIQYKTLELFDEEEETPCPPTDATNSSRDQVDDGKAPGEKKFTASTEATIRNVPAEPQTQSRRKVAFVSVKRSAAASNTNEPVKIPKLDLASNDSLESDDPFLNLLFSGINTSCATNK